MRIASLLASLALSATMVCSCSLANQYRYGRPSVVSETEAMLTDAGFERIDIENSAQQELVANLPAHEIRHYVAAGGAVYWYYDPDLCRCVWVGDDGAYQRFDDARAHENDVAAYVAESDDADALALSSLGGAYLPPPAFLFGGYAPVGLGYGGFPFGGGGHGGRGGHRGSGGGGGRGGHGRGGHR
jgi:uncharacterized membrane protein YgcG